MKKINLFPIISIVLVITCLTQAQDVAPLKLGNVWVYEEFPGLTRFSIVDTNVLIDTINYFKLTIETDAFVGERFVRLTNDGFYALRKDSTYPSPNNEEFYYKLDAKIGDTWTSPQPPTVYTIEDTFVANVFGELTTVKYLVEDAGLVILDEYWTEKFGNLSSFDFGDPLGVLQGCVIDGVVYGDTSFTIVSVEEDLYKRISFNLKQNYPNPFNPSTVISYQIPEQQLVTLKVYDILGNEIAVLINEEIPTGNYEIEFNATGLSSGIYFYRLIAGSFFETKKMVLMK